MSTNYRRNVDYVRLHRAIVVGFSIGLLLCILYKIGIPFNKFAKYEGVRSWQELVQILPAMALITAISATACWLFWPTRR